MKSVLKTNYRKVGGLIRKVATSVPVWVGVGYSFFIGAIFGYILPDYVSVSLTVLVSLLVGGVGFIGWMYVAAVFFSSMMNDPSSFKSGGRRVFYWVTTMMLCEIFSFSLLSFFHDFFSSKEAVSSLALSVSLAGGYIFIWFIFSHKSSKEA